MTHPASSPPCVESGFTLIEMILVIIIVTIIAASGATTLTNSVLAWRVAPDVVDTLSKLRGATERVQREVRETRRNPAATASYDITAMTASQFSFTKSDGTDVGFSIAPPLVNINYSDPATTSVLINQVNSASFSYFQLDGSSATNNSDIAFVEFAIELTNGGNSYPQLIRVGLRNQP